MLLSKAIYSNSYTHLYWCWWFQCKVPTSTSGAVQYLAQGHFDMQTRRMKLATGWEGQRHLPLTVQQTEDLLVRTPPQTGPTMPMRRMAMGMNRAILCWRSVARESRAAGRWKTREETAAHRNTPYHISGQRHRHSVTHQSIPKHSLYSSTVNWSNELMTTNFNCLFLYTSWIYPVVCMLIFLVAASSQLHLFILHWFQSLPSGLLIYLSIYPSIYLSIN